MLSPSPVFYSNDSAIDVGSPPRFASSTLRWRPHDRFAEKLVSISGTLPQNEPLGLLADDEGLIRTATMLPIT
jgi:hypothetical protein